MQRDPWEGLGPDDARRLDASGRHDFFWVVLEDGMPGLMLQLTELPKPAPRLPRLKNLEVALRRMTSGHAFVIGLKERSQMEIFETLCRDVVTAGEVAEKPEEALSRAVRRTRRWHHLLRGGQPDGLSIEEQSGLVGELDFLQELVRGLGSETAIEAWKGPTGALKDFEFIGSCVEVKARRAAARAAVNISSVEQLADVDGSRLFLRVVNVSSAVHPDGRDLHDHVQDTAMLFDEESDEFDAWQEALDATGYIPSQDYEDRRWQLGAATTYEVVAGFPRIPSPLPTGVQQVRYVLSLDSCASFELAGSVVECIREGLAT